MTTEINIDYYEELKRKADELDKRDAGKDVFYTSYGAPVCGNCLVVTSHANYCYHCGYKHIWNVEYSARK